jgi:type ISP restriction-modification system protein/N-6 DNA methylase
MAHTDAFDRYLHSLRAIPSGQKTEHTDRAALQSLLQAFANAAPNPAQVQHEPKRVAEKGAPDFKVTRQGLILGYVETKAIGDNLDRVLKSEQIAKYKTLSNNIVLTDYLHFVWLNKDGVQRETLCYPTDLEAPRFRLSGERVAAVARLLDGFFSSAPEGIGRAEQLALALAARSKLLRDYLGEELVRQQREHREGRLFGLFQIFRDQVFHELTLADFADAFAQMLAYGLFLARLNSGTTLVTLHNAREYVPASFRLIRELVDFLTELERSEYRDVRWVIEEVLSIVNNLNLAAIHEDLSFRQRKAISRKVRAASDEEHRLFERDPFIYFYEDYLKAYDPAMRKGRGVYYTPPPIVNFIVRAVDDILKDSFGIADGLADHRRVTVLDFACGTGTFLLEVCQRIFENIGGADSGRADLIVRDHILKNLFGFEYLIAPYTIAHLKLSQYLRDQGHPLTGDERLQVFLTNTLEPIEPQANFLLPAVSAEVVAAQAVKEKPILVITGNPPYSGHSKNNGTWARNSVLEYRQLLKQQGRPSQSKWLQNDYVKFLRFAQLKMDAINEGMVAVITDHSWLDGPTFVGMRRSLLDSFDRIYILDLHGNSNKVERAPDGGDDQNVFDIKQGVTISLFIKRAGIDKSTYYADVWGKRLVKYELLAEKSIDRVEWNSISPSEPNWLLRSQNAESADEYLSFVGVDDIFSPMGDPAPGVVTTHDQFAISFTPDEAKRKVQTLLGTDTEHEARKLFRLCSQEQWNYQDAKRDLAHLNLDAGLASILYRPFDRRWTVWDRNVVVHRRERVMRHMTNGNIGIVTSRQTKGEIFQHALVSDIPIEVISMSSKTSNNGFLLPMYIDREDGERIENLSSDFREFADARYEHHYAPEEILGYIYAVLHAPTYRARYAEFLRIDFPRVPFPEAAENFEALSGLGWALVQAHLLRELPRRGLAAYHGRGDHTVEAVRYAPADEAIAINTTQSFRPVPQAVWDFHIGGYQVLDKYLKSRKGRVLSLDEIDHLGAVADSLAFTTEQMARIDAAYLAAFPRHG